MGAREPEVDRDRVLIGGREQREIVIVDYDPTWPARYEAELARIRSALGPTALRVEHIGSTAVPGLAAKPIVDLLITVAEIEDQTTFIPPLQAAGYVLRVREPGHLMLRTPERDVHVHVWSDTDPEIGRHLKFRDRLRHSLADRDSYEQLKRELATREWADMNEYAEAKSELINTILGRVDRC